jgi:hypothetical protein
VRGFWSDAMDRREQNKLRFAVFIALGEAAEFLDS